MAKSYDKAHLDEIAHEKWPYWAPVRHQFDIRSFGANVWRGDDGDEVIKRHAEGAEGHEELYLVLSGRAEFEIDGETVDAPEGTFLYIQPPAERVGFARATGTAVLTLGGRPGKPFEVSEWEQKSFDE